MGGRAGGVGLLLFMTLILGVVLVLLKGGDHPLSDLEDYPLCDRIGQNTMSRLSADPVVGYADPPDRQLPGEIVCMVSLYAEMPPERLPGEVRVALLTEALLRQRAGFSQTPASWRENWLAEAAASGIRIEPAEGPWQHGHFMQYPSGSAVMLTEDEGILLLLQARDIERARLRDFAFDLARILRE